MTVKVSVVVPVYNPGSDLERCVQSLAGQSLPKDELQILFVDDGSTDGTAPHLDELAAEHTNVQVVHIPNSGWPGKPRNIGIDAATGDYVQFVDQDDTMAPEALQRLHDMGRRNSADIVIGKVASNFRNVPHGVFRVNVDCCTLKTGPLIDSLTPHKMFRRGFLHEHMLRFPEGRRRLEDQVFMMEAYFAASCVSILGDYPCYFYSRRNDGTNAGSERIDPVGYYNNLREVLDVVEANTQPGDFRNRLLGRFYRGEMFARLSDSTMLEWPADFRAELFDEIRRLALERFPLAVVHALPAAVRLRSELLREDRLDDLVELARRLDGVKVRARLESARWESAALRLQVSAWHTMGDSELTYGGDDHRKLLDDRWTAGLVDPEAFDVSDDLADVTVEIVLRERTSAVEWTVPTNVSSELQELPAQGGRRRWMWIFTCDAAVNPMTLGGGVALDKGVWDLALRVKALGLVRRTRVGSIRPDAMENPPKPAVLGPEGLPVVPYFTVPDNQLSIDVGVCKKSLTRASKTAGIAHAEVVARGQRLTISLPVHYDGTGRSDDIHLALVGEDGETHRLSPDWSLRGGDLLLTVHRKDVATRASGRKRLKGSWKLRLSLDQGAGPLIKVGKVIIRRRLTLEGAGAPAPRGVFGWRRVVRAVRRAARRLGGGGGSAARP